MRCFASAPPFRFNPGVTVMDVYLGILNSDQVARTLVEEFDLSEHYGASTRLRTIKALRSKTRIMPTKHMLIEVAVRDEDPEVAARLANAYVRELDTVFAGTRRSEGERQLEFLETRLRELQTSLDSLDTELTRLQESTRITVLDRQGTEAAEAAAELLARRLNLGTQLEMLDALDVTDAPLRQALEAEMAALEREIGKLPEAGSALARLVRKIRIEERLHEALAHQSELARLEATRDTPAIEVLDVATRPDRHVRPRRGLMTLAALILGTGGAFLLGIYQESGHRD